MSFFYSSPYVLLDFTNSKSAMTQRKGDLLGIGLCLPAPPPDPESGTPRSPFCVVGLSDPTDEQREPVCLLPPSAAAEAALVPC